MNFNKKVKAIVMGLLDQLIYVEGSRDPNELSIMHFKGSAYWEAKSRFPNIIAEDILSYQNLVGAIEKSVGGIATSNVWDREEHTIEKVTTSQEDFNQLKDELLQVASAKIEQVGQAPILEEINTTLMKKISETDLSDFEMMKVLLSRLNNM
jgi:hypothetical protein